MVDRYVGRYNNGAEPVPCLGTTEPQKANETNRPPYSSCKLFKI